MDSITRLFDQFALLYGTRLADLWRGTNAQRVKEAWREGLNGFSVGEVRAGLAACRTKPWPPTLPEFMLLCRPPLDFEQAYAIAQQQISKRAFGDDVWPSKAVYWAAVEFGFHDLRTLAWQVAKARWSRILVEQLSKEGTLPDVPKPVPALAAPGKGYTDIETSKKNLAEVKAMLKKSVA